MLSKETGRPYQYLEFWQPFAERTGKGGDGLGNRSVRWGEPRFDLCPKRGGEKLDVQCAQEPRHRSVGDHVKGGKCLHYYF